MIWRWRICSSSLLLLGIAAASPARAGNVTGVVELTNSNDVSTRKGHNYSGVVLWLDPVPRPANLPVSVNRAEMAQRNKPVSYTHLDVYKRQQVIRTVRPLRSTSSAWR